MAFPVDLDALSSADPKAYCRDPTAARRAAPICRSERIFARRTGFVTPAARDAGHLPDVVRQRTAMA